MGIYKNGKPITLIYFHGLPVQAVFVGRKRVWPGVISIIPSCYASGYWQDQYPWTDNTPWKD